MGLFSKSKDKGSKESHSDQSSYSSSSGKIPSYQPPSGPPPSFSAGSGSSSQQVHYAPPPGPPPPSHNDYTQPPPSSSHPSYGPPSDLPPAYEGSSQEFQGPPPVPSMWTSPTSNASYDDGKRAFQFTRQFPIAPPVFLQQHHLDSIQRGETTLLPPPQMRGSVTQLSPTTVRVVTDPVNPDGSLLSFLPLYSVRAHQPREKEGRTLYYEIKIQSLGRPGSETSVAVGYCAAPYPTWRMPGHQRGSLGVHSDDGNRFINDSYGGRPFTQPFRVGDTIGLGIRFKMMRAEIFLTRNGQEAGKWWLDEEVDSMEVQDEGINGLQGECDLFACVGIYREADIIVDFGPKEWSQT